MYDFSCCSSNISVCILFPRDNFISASWNPVELYVHWYYEYFNGIVNVEILITIYNVMSPYKCEELVSMQYLSYLLSVLFKKWHLYVYFDINYDPDKC